MIGATGRKTAWAQAALLSISLHGAAAATLIYRPSWNLTAAPPPEQLQLEITALNQPSTAVETPTLTSVTAMDDQTVKAAPDEEARQPEEEVLAHLNDNAITPLLQDQTLPRVQPPSIGPASSSEGAGAPHPNPENSETTPTDPRLAELFDRIRNLLTEPCLLALPSLRGDDAIQLGVLAASDRKISQLMNDLTRGLATEVTEAAVLLDQRQCPGLSFARQDPSYPVFGLGVQLESQDVSSGSSLRGQISGGAGWYNTLLLVDDNGVVHDLRRFLIRSSNHIRFDVPVARSGAARDTHQLIVAVATPQRPETISQLSGQSAAPFFDALIREVGENAMVGINSVYVR